MSSTDYFLQINSPDSLNSRAQHKHAEDSIASSRHYVADAQPLHRLIRLKDVMATTGVARTFIYSEIKQGRFPAPVKAGSASLWVEAEVQMWIEHRIASRQLY